VPDLAGTRVVVTGGTSGLGRAMAEALAAAGARVAITSRQQARATAAADEIGGGTCGVELDVRDELSVDAFVEQAYALG
jgi:NAD(P)-dependent dehydrogenase (short-subunit alcohol dehydrogenase family)